MNHTLNRDRHLDGLARRSFLGTAMAMAAWPVVLVCSGQANVTRTTVPVECQDVMPSPCDACARCASRFCRFRTARLERSV